jgi:YqaJ-like viral recombinase domain
MTVERIPITDRQQWLALRQHDVTASVAGCLLGVHEYVTPFGLWALKSGRVQEDPEESIAMRRGRLLEPVAAVLISEEHPAWKVTPPGVYLRDPEARLGATPDLFIEDQDAGFGVIQVKSVEPSIFRRSWRDEKTGEVNPPLWIAVQAIVEASLAGASWAAVAAMRVGFGLDLELVPVPIHAGVITRVRAAVAEFWRMVESGQRPDADWKRDLEMIESLYEPTGEILDLSDRNDLPVLADEKQRLTQERSTIESRLKEIKGELLTTLDGASAAKIADGRVISAKRVNRKAYEVAASTYVDLRIQRAEARPPRSAA